MNKTRTLFILIENSTGALSRVCDLLSARGYNIESLTVAPTHDDSFSRITMSVSVDNEAHAQQITKQINKLINVVKVSDVTGSHYQMYEILLVKVKLFKEEQKQAIMRLATIFEAKIVDVYKEFHTVRLVDNDANISHFLEELQIFQIVESVRSGSVGLEKGKQGF